MTTLTPASPPEALAQRDAVLIGQDAPILLVEDDDDHAELITLAMQEYDPDGNVDRVRDGEAALAYLRKEGAYAGVARPVAIFLDLRMPKVSGLEVLAAVKADKELAAIPIVVLTTSAAQSDLLSAYKNHVNSFVVKPQDFEEFGRLIQDLYRYWAGSNRLPEPPRR